MPARAGWRWALLCVALGCSRGAESGRGGVVSAPNTVPVVVNAGPAGPQAAYVNGLFASATVCVPGNDASCQTIDGLLVDTTSSGLRVLSSVLTLSLPKQIDAGEQPLANCAQFADSTYLWGEVAIGDIKMGSERASSVPIQLIAAPGSSAFPAPPADCASGGGVNAGTLDELGANGILGISSFRQDCGDACVTDASVGVYYRCTPSGCGPTTVALTEQVANPVWMLSSDNNGTIISLAPIAAGGAVSATGTLTFGIGTRANNALGAAPLLVPDADGYLSTVFENRTYGSSVIDSGSNAIFFLDSASSGLAICKQYSQFYCPPATVTLSASLSSVTGASAGVTFDMANAESLFAATDETAFDDLGGPNTPLDGFLWGLPFFFDRDVATAIEGQATPAGVGPFWALP